VPAFFPTETESEPAQELLNARIRFLHSLGMPNIRMYLSINDQSRWRIIYPGELD